MTPGGAMAGLRVWLHEGHHREPVGPAEVDRRIALPRPSRTVRSLHAKSIRRIVCAYRAAS